MDEAILRAVNGLAAEPGWAAVGTLLSSRVMILLVCGPLAVWLARRRRGWAMLSIALAMGAADAVTARVLKPVIARERPCRALEDLVEAAPCGAGRSMPSGHASVAFAFAGAAAPTVTYGWWVFVPIATAVAASRILLGVHYPSDALVGAAWGLVVGLAFSALRRRFEAAR